MKKVTHLLAGLAIGVLLSISSPVVAQTNDSNTTNTTAATHNTDDNSGKWGLAGLLGLLGLLGLRKKDDVARLRTDVNR